MHNRVRIFLQKYGNEDSFNNLYRIKLSSTFQISKAVLEDIPPWALLSKVRDLRSNLLSHIDDAIITLCMDLDHENENSQKVEK